MTPDPGRLRALLDRIADEASHLHRLAALDDTAFQDQPDLLAAVKYRFVVAIEAAIDVCRHLVATGGLRVPADFADSFRVLAEAGVLPTPLGQRLQDMARLWNLLVHGYARVDDDRVLVILRSSVADLDAFRAEVARHSSR